PSKKCFLGQFNNMLTTTKPGSPTHHNHASLDQVPQPRRRRRP
uniref:Uncharacterized protein n=1 Tax=Aegilops tauschii subsp. strangulata TaxID=200361 RepID=A0A453EGW4_AEGTS